MLISSPSIALREKRLIMAREPRGNERTSLAVIFGPPIGSAVGMCVLGVLINIIWFVRFGESFPSVHGFWTLPFLGAMAGAVLGIPATLVMGLPIHALLTQFKLRSAAIYAGAGAFGGILLALTAGQIGLLDVLNSDVPKEDLLSNLVPSVRVFPQAVTLGTSSSLGFWLIRRPDRDAPNPGTRAP